jgi:hypothetical protein
MKITKIFNKKKESRSREFSLNNTDQTNKSEHYDTTTEFNKISNPNRNLSTNNKIVSNFKSNPQTIQKIVINFDKRLKNISIDGSNFKREK